MAGQAMLQGVVCYVGIGGAVISFGVYLLITFGAHKPSAQDEIEKNAAAARSFAPPTPAQASEMIKALASLTTSLAKAGPALWSLTFSALFLLIAALAAGVFQAGPPTTSATSNAADNVIDDNGTGDNDAGADLPKGENMPVGHKTKP